MPASTPVPRLPLSLVLAQHPRGLGLQPGLAICLDLLGDLAAYHEHGVAHGRVRPGAVTVGRAGDIALTWADPVPGIGTAMREDVMRALDILALCLDGGTAPLPRRAGGMRDRTVAERLPLLLDEPLRSVFGFVGYAGRHVPSTAEVRERIEATADAVFGQDWRDHARELLAAQAGIGPATPAQATLIPGTPTPAAPAAQQAAPRRGRIRRWLRPAR